MALEVFLGCIAALLATGLAALILSRRGVATPLVYAVSLAVSSLALAGSTAALLHPAALGATLTLPIGLPWLGAHFRLDALSAFFLVVVNRGAAAASLYGLGYGRHEEAPARVLPFFPAFLGAMNLVVLADDAFTFLFAWEYPPAARERAALGSPGRARCRHRGRR